jgi:hypothetical protein
MARGEHGPTGPAGLVRQDIEPFIPRGLDPVAHRQVSRHQSGVHDQNPNRDNPKEDRWTNQIISSAFPDHCKPTVIEAV